MLIVNEFQIIKNGIKYTILWHHAKIREKHNPNFLFYGQTAANGISF